MRYQAIIIIFMFNFHGTDYTSLFIDLKNCIFFLLWLSLEDSVVFFFLEVLLNGALVGRRFLQL